jgi:hypothetical protein
MDSTVTPIFKNFISPVRAQTTAKQTDQEMSSLIFNRFN